MKNPTSRRAHRRYEVKDGAFAVLFQDSSKLGQITDISLSGFSFRYSDSRHIDNDRDGRAVLYHDYRRQLEDFTAFDLFLVDSGIYLDRIPCKIISNLDIDEPESSNTISMKRCGIEFDRLVPEQISDLAYFIKNCAVAAE